MTAAPPPTSPPPPQWEPPPGAPPPGGAPPGGRPWEDPFRETPSGEAPPAPRPPLRRSPTDRVVGGVSGGLAEYTGIDALLWRVGFVALAVAGGTGVLLYLLLWVVMPPATVPTNAVPTSGARAAGSRARRGRAPAAPRTPVPRVTLAAALIALGVLAFLTRVGGWHLGPRAFLGTALLVVGLGLLALGLAGRSRGRGGLIALGIVLTLALGVASSRPWHLAGDVGDHTFRPVSADAVRATYEGGVGNLTVDLSGVALAGARTPIRTQIDGGIGNVHVVVPASADVEVTVDRGLGNVDVFGDGASDGLHPGTGSASWTGDGHPEFALTIDAGIGNVEVSRA